MIECALEQKAVGLIYPNDGTRHDALSALLGESWIAVGRLGGNLGKIEHEEICG